MLELWGVGDLALAMPFLRQASTHARVTLLAKAHAAPLLQRFAPQVKLLVLNAPWTAFTHKYHLHRWRWPVLRRVLREMRRRGFDAAVSARPDPRDHVLMRLTGARRRVGFPRTGSAPLLTDRLTRPGSLHRAAHWQRLADHLDWPSTAPPPPEVPANIRRIVFHTGAGHPVRRWPPERFAELAVRARAAGFEVTTLDDGIDSLDTLMNELARGDFFVGNDSGPGHLAASLGIATFTIFGAQLPETFHPVHPRASWIEGAPCPHKPCFDRCRFERPHCLLDLSVDAVWSELAKALPASSPA